MSSAEHESGEPAPHAVRSRPDFVVIEGGAGAGVLSGRPANRLATASLAAGACGFTLVTIIPGLVLGALGLRRAGRVRRGRVRCWLGIGSSLAWAALAAYLIPHLLRAADPGCTAYKGPGLTAYGKVVADFSEAGPRTGLNRDLSRAIGQLRAAAARSGDPAVRQALTGLAADLQPVLAGIRSRTGVPRQALARLNQAAAHADHACGTLQL